MRTLAVEDNGGSRLSDVDMGGSLRFTWSRILFQNTHNCSTVPFFSSKKKMFDLVRHITTVFSRVTRSCPALSVTHVNRAALARSVTDVKHQIPSRKNTERITIDRKAVD